MPNRFIENRQRTPHAATSVLLFVVFTAAMAYLRLFVYQDRMIPLTYGLPLLICLWYPSRRLLWSMTVTFVVLSAIKAFVVLPQPAEPDVVRGTQWVMQVVNILLIAITVQVVLQLMEKLSTRNANLERLNADLILRDEEISRQNEELQAQNEEIEQQAEELQQQAEELEAQSAELQSANSELIQRQSALESMLHALDTGFETGDAPQHVCDAALRLLASDAIAAAILLRDGDELFVRGSAGRISPKQPRWRLTNSLAVIVLDKRRPAAISDLLQRPDVIVPAPASGSFRSVLAAPVFLGGQVAGSLEFYSDQAHSWTREHFAIAEWAANQCSLILEARRLRDQLQAANAVLEGEVKERTHELEELVNELEHFSYTITHDLRAPLRAMQGYAGILAEESLKCLDDTSRGYLNRITMAATRMDQLITDALSYSRAVRQEFAMVPVDTDKLVRSILESYPNFQDPKAHIEIVGELPPVLANEAGLTQCLSNLLGNAVKFVPAGTLPHVKIWAENGKTTVRLWIEDNGIGIAPEMHSRLFSMFQRLSKSYEGTGIGLALVRKVAERMGGSVGVDSALGKGSRFWLELKSNPNS